MPPEAVTGRQRRPIIVVPSCPEPLVESAARELARRLGRPFGVAPGRAAEPECNGQARVTYRASAADAPGGPGDALGIWCYVGPETGGGETGLAGAGDAWAVWVDGRRVDARGLATRMEQALDRLAPEVATAGWVLAGDDSYPLYVDRDVLAAAGPGGRGVAIARRLAAGRRDCGLFVVADAAVAGSWGRAVQALMAGVGMMGALAEVGPGEAAKQLATVEGLYTRAIATGLERQGLVAGVGGGAALDTAGYLAATYMRGVAWAAFPTTLLAMVDAAVGGKTAVNHPMAKNVIGAFHRPLAVVADVATLGGLPLRELRSGLSEIIKHGLVADPQLLEMTARWVDEVMPGGADAVGSETTARLVRQAVRVKAWVVSDDEREQGRRIILNFGHTVAHALEAASRFSGRLSHGEAVAIGMVTALLLSRRLGLLQQADAVIAQTVGLLRRAGLPVTPPPDAPDARRLWEHMAQDKKVHGQVRRWVLLEAPGRPRVVGEAVEASLFVEVWAEQRRMGGGER